MSAGYEKKDVSVKAIAVASFLVVAMIVAFVVLLNDYFVYNQEVYVEENVGGKYSEDLAKIALEETKLLTTYKVIDSQKGIYQIPIEQAMKLVVEDYAKK